MFILCAPEQEFARQLSGFAITCRNVGFFLLLLLVVFSAVSVCLSLSLSFPCFLDHEILPTNTHTHTHRMFTWAKRSQENWNSSACTTATPYKSQLWSVTSFFLAWTWFIPLPPLLLSYWELEWVSKPRAFCDRAGWWDHCCLFCVHTSWPAMDAESLRIGSLAWLRDNHMRLGVRLATTNQRNLRHRTLYLFRMDRFVAECVWVWHV